MAITDAIVANKSFLINIRIVLLKVRLPKAKLGAGSRKQGIQMLQIRYRNDCFFDFCPLKWLKKRPDQATYSCHCLTSEDLNTVKLSEISIGSEWWRRSGRHGCCLKGFIWQSPRPFMGSVSS